MRCVALVLTTIGVLAAAGCGERESTLAPRPAEPLTLLLDFFPNGDHAGIYAAEAAGEFRRAGLDVTVRAPADPSAPIKQVAARRVDLAVSYEPEVLRARDQGLPVVAVGALVQRPLTSIISLPKAGIRNVRDLRGKTVGTAGIDYQAAFLKTVLREAGVDPATVKQRDVGFNLSPALLSGRVDATLGGFYNYEGVDLRQRGRDPRIIPVDEAGVPPYDELVLVAHEDAVKENGGRLRRFLAALEEGTAALERDPEGGLRALLKANRDLEPRLQRAVVEETLPLFEPPRGRPYGWQEPGEWSAFAAWMRENGLLEEEPDAEAAYTNRLLPGQGP